MITGGCRCGAVRYTIELDRMPRTYACHCTLCQRASGSSFAHQMPVPESVLSVTGALRTAVVTSASGAISTSYHCEACVARLYSSNSRWPGMAIVRADTVDGSERLMPALHIYTSTKQPWIALPPDVLAMRKAPRPRPSQRCSELGGPFRSVRSTSRAVCQRYLRNRKNRDGFSSHGYWTAVTFRPVLPPAMVRQRPLSAFTRRKREPLNGA